MPPWPPAPSSCSACGARGGATWPPGSCWAPGWGWRSLCPHAAGNRAGLGLAALFLYLDTSFSSTTGASITILFGSIFAIDSSLVPVIAVLTAISLGTVLLLYRMLLFSSLSPEMAAARTVPVRAVGIGYLVALALAVSLSAMTIGAVLSTALLVGPAACALRLTKRPGLALALAALIGVAVTWVSIVLAYDSYYWPPGGRGWPVSFFVVALIFTAYLLTQIPIPGWFSRRQPGRAMVDVGMARR